MDPPATDLTMPKKKLDRAPKQGEPQGATAATMGGQPALRAGRTCRDCGDAAMDRLAAEQMEVNQALVAKIFQCEVAEQALRESEQKLHQLLARQLSIREEERKRISREIHDHLGQNLLALRLDVATLHRQTADKQKRLHNWVGAALDNLDGTIRTVRQIIADLRPFQLELGLLSAIEWELNKFERLCGIRCTLSGKACIDELVLPDERNLAAYRALQECLSNIFRHSLASRVTVELGVEDGVLTMTVCDNGVGFDPEHAHKSSSFGLLDVRERLALVGGKLDVAGSQSHGTRVVVSIPIA